MRWLTRTVGIAAGSTLALALLVLGCVFTAMAGPALSLHTRTEALHQTLAGLDSPGKAIQMSAAWGDFVGDLTENGAQTSRNLTITELEQSTQEIAGGLAATPLPVAADDWAALTTNTHAVTAGAARSAQAGAPPKLEVVYRDPLTSNARLVTGTYTGGNLPAGTVAVSATRQTAARFGLKPGSRLKLATSVGQVTLLVTGILTERGPGSAFWTQDSAVAAPSLDVPSVGSPYWVGGIFADPDQFNAMQNAFSGPGMELEWEFPINVGGVTAGQAQQLYDDLNRAVASTAVLAPPLLEAADTISVSTPLVASLSLFLATQAAIETVLLLLFVSLIVVGAAVIVLAARMIVARREGELSLLRARGGSLWQVAGLVLRAAVIAAGPAAVIGAVLAITLIPGGTQTSLSGWPLAAITVAAALGSPPLIAVWQHRKAAPAANPALITSAETNVSRRAWRRPVAEVTACAASIAGLIVLRNQGIPAGGGIDLYLTITPVLVAIPVVVVMLRLYPLTVRGLLVLSARRPGATGFVALSRAARSSLTGALPAFALVLALSLATFAGMVNDGITRGEIAASWQATGGDVLINAGPSASVSTAAVRAIGAVRGVRHATAVWNTSWITPDGRSVEVVAVDPASYAALVSSTPFAAFPVARIGTATGRTLSPSAIVPVLASPSAAALLGSGSTQLTSLYPMGPFRVRVAGTLSSTPAQPGGGDYVVMPLDNLPGLAGAGQPAPNMVLVTGSGIDDARLSAVASKVIAGSTVIFRSAVLASLASSPLQHGATLIIVLTIAAAAAFGLFIVILGLALGSAERELTLARLNVMGHERATRLVMAEAMPAVLAAVVAGAVCAVALPRAIGSAIDLSAFTGTSAPVQFSPDVIAVGLPAVIIVLLALAVLTAETRALRRHGVTGMIRAH
jgi:putative ABC transport system permease protein